MHQRLRMRCDKPFIKHHHTMTGWLLGAAILAMPLNANSAIKEEQPVVLEAADMGYDQKNGIVVARGDVEVVHGEYILRADQLTYYQQSSIIRAEGNVSLLQPSGEVVFADEVELTDDLKTGVVQQFKARLADGSVFVAQDGVRENPFRTKLKKASYSPCKICTGEDPFWQLRAEKVDIDEFHEKITYDNAWLELGGVPIFYTPTLSHPTPSADAQNGFLVPEYSTSSQLGQIVRAPYYWRIAPNIQATITPWYTSEDGPVLQTHYEHLTDHGSHSIEFSGTFPDKRENSDTPVGGSEFRGHIYALGDHHFDDVWSVGYDINRSTDDTYLRRYGFGNERTLFSRAYVEGVDGRNYASLSGLAIQGLRVFDDPDTTPLVVPILEGYYETNPNSFGLRYFTAAQAQSLSRKLGVDQDRLSTTIGAQLPYVSDSGQLFTLTTSIRTDFYNYSNVPDPNSAGTLSGDKTRATPLAALEWRYPLAKQFDSGGSLTVEPIVLGVVQPKGGNPVEISNEDSRVVELTDTNIFAIERFPGLDQVDSGSRVAYGARTQYLAPTGEVFEFMLGQSFNTDDTTPFPNSNEPGEHFSDYIGRIAYYDDYISAGYRFSLDRDNLEPNRNELFTSLHYEEYSLNTSYLKLKDNTFLGDSEQISGGVGFPVYEDWHGEFLFRRDLELDQNISHEARLYYQNECFTLSLNAGRIFTRDRDLEPSTEFTVRVGFKNLGEFGSE